MQNTEIKPCPFCGCHDRRVGIRRMGKKGYKVICGVCGGSGPYIALKDFDDKMVAQHHARNTWNSRRV